MAGTGMEVARIVRSALEGSWDFVHRGILLRGRKAEAARFKRVFILKKPKGKTEGSSGVWLRLTIVFLLSLPVYFFLYGILFFFSLFLLPFAIFKAIWEAHCPGNVKVDERLRGGRLKLASRMGRRILRRARLAKRPIPEKV